MHPDWLDDTGSLLGHRSPLPLDAPFTREDALRLGVSRRSFDALARAGLVRRVLHGVYAAAQAPDDLRSRAAALGLVVPPHAVVSDRTAAWLHGVEILPRSAVTVPPPVQVVSTEDTRVRRPEADGHRRALLERDVQVLHDVRVTSPLRTALDLGRLLWRFDALAALDGFLRAGLSHEAVLGDLGRFRGFRGVRQLRVLAPLADARSQSPAESALRLWWYDALLPVPQPQLVVPHDHGSWFALDLADPAALYAAEYDGAEFHTTPEDRRYDADRRAWLAEERGWSIEVFTKDDLYGPRADPVPRLQEGHHRARRSLSRWSPGMPGAA